MEKQIYSKRSKNLSPAIFLDRDGTINKEIGYLHKIKEWQWCEGALESIVAIKNTNFKVIIITNQAGIARGYYSKKEVFKLHSWLYNQITINLGRIDAIYFCPHHPNYGKRIDCNCRKPSSGMILEAKKDLNLDLSQSWIIGDKITDIEAGKNAGVKTILLPDGNKSNNYRDESFSDYRKSNINSAIDFILSNK